MAIELQTVLCYNGALGLLIKAMENTEKSPEGILVLDDDVSLCHMLKDTLEEYGFEVRYTENCEEAVQIIQDFHPQAALVDFHLGAMTGIECIQQLKTADPDHAQHFV